VYIIHAMHMSHMLKFRIHFEEYKYQNIDYNIICSHYMVKFLINYCIYLIHFIVRWLRVLDSDISFCLIDFYFALRYISHI